MHYRWVVLAVLFLARTSMAFQFQSVAALAPLVAADHGASLADIGLLIGLYFAPGIVIAIPGGAIARLLGDRRVLAGGMVLMLAGGLLPALSGSWDALVAGRLIAGIGGVVLNVQLAKMLTDWFLGREIATAMAVLINAWPIGIATALLVLPAMADPGNLAPAWLTVLALVALGFALFLLAWRSPPAASANEAGAGRAVALPLVALSLAGAVWALYNGALVMVFGFGPTLLSERGWPLAEASSTTSIVLWLMVVSVPLGGLLADRSGRRDTVLALGLAGFALLLVAAALAPLRAVPAIFVGLGLVSGISGGPILSLPSLVLRPETRALGMGVFFTFSYLALMISPTLGGWLAERTGDAGTAFVLGAAMLVLGLAALGLFRRDVGRAATAAPRPRS